MWRFSFLLFGLALACLPSHAMADAGLPTAPYIYVEGRAESEKPADMVTLRFDISDLEAKQEAANASVQKQANQIFAILKASTISESDVIAGDLQSEAEYEEVESPSSSRRGKLLGYRVTRTFSVVVHDLILFPKLVDQLLGLQVHEFSSITPGLKDAKVMEEDVLGQSGRQCS